jgi:STE24 endopeptidase
MAGMDAHLVTMLFVGLVVIATGLQLWLTRRQIRHVQQHRAAVPSAFSGSISLEAHQKAADYTAARQNFSLVRLALSLLMLIGWTLLGGLETLNSALQPFGIALGGLGYQVALVFVFSLIGGLIELPLDWYSHFRIEQRFGFNRMSLALWLTDLIKNFFVSVLIGLPLIAMVLWLMGAAGTTWWLWAWGAWVAFNLLLMVIYPVWIAPLFNNFQPLEDETLKQRVQALMQRCGFAAEGLFVMDGSKRSAESNAYFTGLGKAKRVVFYDTLLARLSHDELEAVLAHELGHFHHRHLRKSLISIFAITLAGFAALGWLSMQQAFFVGLGVTPNAALPNDALAILLFLLVIPTVSPLIEPVWSAASRRHEFEADAYAKQQASAPALVQALVKLTEDNAVTLTPDPVYVRFHYSHPPMLERIAALES